MFTLGQGSVIKGWDVGVATMKKGEKALLTCRWVGGWGPGSQGAWEPEGQSSLLQLPRLDTNTLVD